MAVFETAQEVINGAASEAGLVASTDVFASTDQAFVQLRTLLTSAGQELLSLHEWQKLVKVHSITTAVPPDDGNYDLPEDFAYIIDQTGWSPLEGGSGLPLGGPLSEQDWAYLVNTNLASSTVYVSFKLSQGQFQVLPQPPPDGIELNFRYISRWWVATTGTTTPAQSSVTANDNVVLFEPILIKKFLKLRFLEAKGFDTTAAVAQFLNMFNNWTGKDIAAPVLNLARMRIFPYLGYRNIPESRYGMP